MNKQTDTNQCKSEDLKLFMLGCNCTLLVCVCVCDPISSQQRLRRKSTSTQSQSRDNQHTMREVVVVVEPFVVHMTNGAEGEADAGVDDSDAGLTS